MNLFSGVKVLDLTRVFSGPFATRHFSDFGAEVIKIEPPTGDDSRNFPPLKNNWSGYFEILNHNKKSLTLNLKDPKDLDKFYKLCKTADVVVENFSPLVTKRLKVDYESVKRFNEKIIYASILGVSEKVDRKYYDVIAQAESGLISLNGETSDTKISTSVVDAFSGMKLAFAISSALYYRQKTGIGQKINVSMKGSAFDLLEQNLIESSVTGKNPRKVGNMDNAIAPFGLFKTKDGSIVLAIGNDIIWNNFVKLFKARNNNLLDQNFSNNQNRLVNIALLKSEIEVVFKDFNTYELSNLLKFNEIPSGEVKKMMDVLADPENYSEHLLKKIKHTIAGSIVIPMGGISYSKVKQEKYIESPEK